MSLLNRFLIEEDIQFECAGVVERYMDTNLIMERNLLKSLKRISNESNSDFIGHLVLSGDTREMILTNYFSQIIYDNLKKDMEDSVQIFRWIWSD